MNKDSLMARMEHHEKEYIEDRLRILGYLTLHNKQLDMVMGNDSEVRYYKGKINNDIRKLSA